MSTGETIKREIVSAINFIFLFSVGTFYFIIGAVGGAVVILLLLIILSICVILSLRNKRSKRSRCKSSCGLLVHVLYFS